LTNHPLQGKSTQIRKALKSDRKNYRNYIAMTKKTTNVTDAIAREQQIKGWLRAKKIALIESANLQWYKLSSE
jgi:putative endonuclease